MYEMSLHFDPKNGTLSVRRGEGEVIIGNFLIDDTQTRDLTPKEIRDLHNMFGWAVHWMDEEQMKNVAPSAK